jgi:hypothetical protein
MTTSNESINNKMSATRIIRICYIDCVAHLLNYLWLYQKTTSASSSSLYLPSLPLTLSTIYKYFGRRLAQSSMQRDLVWIAYRYNYLASVHRIRAAISIYYPCNRRCEWATKESDDQYTDLVLNSP